MILSNMHFNFAHFANFDFAHFKVEEKFELIWVKLLANLHFGYLKGARFRYGLYFCSFCV